MSSFKRLKSFESGTRHAARAAPAAAKDWAKRLAPAIVLLTSLVVHFWQLGEPREVVFDEVHFGKFMTSYCCSKERFFDIHPPHAKLLLSGAAKLGGYDGGFSFDHIGQPYGKVSPWSLRWFSALMGAFLPLLVWLLLRQLGASRPASFLGGFAVALDNGLLVQSRMMGLDSTLLMFTFGALSIFLHAMRRGTTRRWIWMLLAGFVGGLAVGTKVTGLAVFGVMSLVLLRPFLSRRNGENLRFGLKGIGILAVGALPAYLAGFLMHFSLLTQPGPGDRFYKPTGHLVEDFVGLQRVMLSANYFLTKTHPASSRWWEWPLGKKPIFYWVSGKRTIYLWGNPTLWWGTTLLMLLVLGTIALGRVTSLQLTSGDSRSRVLQWIPLAGFVMSFGPMVFIPRALFLYHYFTPLVFGTIYLALWLDGADWIVSSRFRRQRRSYYVLLALLVVGFLVVAPVSYGTTAPLQWHRTLANFLQNLR